MIGVDLYSEISSYNPKSAIEVPDKVRAFRSLKVGGKVKKDDENEFWKQPFAQEFLDNPDPENPGKWQIELHNRDCFFRLWELYQQRTDEKEKAAILTKLDIFKNNIINYNAKEPIFPSLLIDFKNYPFKSASGELLETVNAQFSD